jgi:hypothetical protein
MLPDTSDLTTRTVLSTVLLPLLAAPAVFQRRRWLIPGFAGGILLVQGFGFDPVILQSGYCDTFRSTWLWWLYCNGGVLV